MAATTLYKVPFRFGCCKNAIWMPPSGSDDIDVPVHGCASCLQVLYDDMYDEDYQEPELESGQCLGPDVCGTAAQQGSTNTAAPPPTPQEPRNFRRRLMHSNNADTATATATAATASAASSSFKEVTEVNIKDTSDGKGFDPQFGEGPLGETLCDAPPHRSFNYYG